MKMDKIKILIDVFFRLCESIGASKLEILEVLRSCFLAVYVGLAEDLRAEYAAKMGLTEEQAASLFIMANKELQEYKNK